MRDGSLEAELDAGIAGAGIGIYHLQRLVLRRGEIGKEAKLTDFSLVSDSCLQFGFVCWAMAERMQTAEIAFP